MADDFEARLHRVANGFQEAKIMLAGVELGLYDRLADGPATAHELAGELGVTLRGVEILADALTATGFLTKDGDGRYANADGTDRLLVRGRPGSVAYIMGHRNQMFRTWAQLEDVVRHGKQTRDRDRATLNDPVANRNFILGMAEVSRARVGPILDALPLAGARRFVDLGGGPAHYCCEAVRRHDGLTAELVDLPLTVKVAREYIAGQGLSDRVSTRVVDFYAADEIALDEPADVLLVSQVLHAEGPDENRALLRKLAACVRPGGHLAVVENMVAGDRTRPPWGAMFAVNMLAGTSRGRTYTADEIATWISEAGFEPGEAVEAAHRAWVLLGERV